MISPNQQDVCNNQSHQENCHSRRQFMRKLGKTLFAVTIVDIADVSLSPAMAADECTISQLPDPYKYPDVFCTVTGSEPDGCCGDCDDDHETDAHCGKAVPGGIDEDELCGHTHYWGGDEDQACSGNVADVGCGKHDAGYTQLGGTFNDTDQSCGGPQADQNCSSSQAIDANCNSKANPSTTSPDEKCGQTNSDGACSHYDADESCSQSNTDESCGTYGEGQYQDVDGHCCLSNDSSDGSDDPNEGPIAPYCSDAEDSDYWDPAPPGE